MSKHTSKHKSRRFRRFLRANEAVSALEYALLVGIVATALAVAITTFSDSVSTALGNIGTAISSGGAPAVDLDGVAGT